MYIQVFEEIRKYIICNELSVGDRLPTEKEMCQMLGVSRNVLREAIKAFEIMGIVTCNPSKGITLNAFNIDFMFQSTFYFLIANDIKFIEEIRKIRQVLEMGLLSKVFAKISESEIQTLKVLLEHMKKKAENEKKFLKKTKRFI